MFTKAVVFRQKFLQANEPLRIVGAHDGLGAQLIARHGFDGVWASGLEISASHGVPDANILTMTQYLERCQEMHAASPLPVIADVDTGYGNANNVRHMVQQYEAAGIAGAVMEDKLFPKVNSFVPGRQDLASIAEFSGKLEAAKDARTGKDFLVIARVEALIAGWGMEEALKRAEAYVKAGADGILIHSKRQQPDEIRTFLKAWNRRSPIVLVPTTYPSMAYEEMREAGVNMIIYANQCLRASVKAMHDTLETIARDRSTVAVEEAIAPLQEIFELQGMLAMKENEKKYLRTGKTVHVVIPAAGVPRHEGKMKELLKDTPVAMLPVEGRPLIHRIIDAVNRAGMQDVTVVTGYLGDKVMLETGEKRQADDEGETGILHSILAATDKFSDSVLLHYGDVIVSAENLRSFITCEEPIVILMSPLQREGRYKRKSFDFVSLKRPVPEGARTLDRHPRNILAAIGTNLAPERAHGEFVGLVFLNSEGVGQWKRAISALSEEERRSFSLTQFLQRMLDCGVPISTFEARTGWAEVHSFEDYEELCALLCQP